MGIQLSPAFSAKLTIPSLFSPSHPFSRKNGVNLEFSSYYANVRLLGDLQHDQKCFLHFSQKLFRILTCGFLHVVGSKIAHLF